MDYPGNTTPQNSDDIELTVKKILLALITGSGGGGGGGSVTQGTNPWIVQPAAVTPHFAAPTAGSTTVVPIGAIGAGILILTGTGTINGVAWPAGTPWNDPNKLAATVTLILDNPGTAVVYYGT